MSTAAFTSSPFVGSIEPITETDDEIRAAVEAAEIPPLLPALAYLTGDMSLLRADLRPDPLMIGMPQGGLTDAQLATARDLAVDALIAYRDGGCQPAPLPTDEQLLEIMEHAVAGNDMDPYLPLLEEELAFRGEDRRAPGWHKNDVAPDVDFRVVIIGAGMSGLLAAYRLKQAGVEFVIVEKDEDVGGTWLENTYPGCRVDNPNHNYSYSFAERHDWPLHFSTQDVLLDYFRRCADVFDLRKHIQFSTEVLDATWSDSDFEWTVRVRRADGSEESLTAPAVISAVGQLNRPLMPDIAGLDAFAGPSFHSARWNHDIDLRGKRVAVIGTGASAVQFIPEIAPVVGELLVFQRTPPWLGPTPDYHDEVSPELRWLYAHVPSYSEFNRFWIFWRMGDGVLPGVTVDPAWDRSTGSVSGMNEMVRMVMSMYLESEFADRPDLLEKVMPSYPPGAKRLLRDNGVWAGALKRDNVQLVTDSIREITPTGVVTHDGTEHPVDVIIYGTGFAASKFLTPMRVSGRGGIDLHEQWGGDARAYLGINVPGFPNLFCLYGPNTNIVINGSIVYFSECGVRYILGCLRLLLAERHRALDIRKDVHDEFNEAVDAENARMAWGASDVNSWYKNEHGHVTQNWPFTLLEYWQRTLAPDPTNYELLDDIVARFIDKIAIVTGGGSGIGRATALLLAAEGASVTVADIDEGAATSVANEIGAEGGTVLGQRTDVSDADAVAAMVAETVSAFGGVDILHNNAAALDQNRADQDIVNMDLATWDRVMAVNLTGPMLGCRYAIPAMIERGGGAIVNTASAAAFYGSTSLAAYGTSKAGVVALTRYVATAYADRGIRCNAVAPGVVVPQAAQDALGGPMGPRLRKYTKSHLVGRLGYPEEIAAAVAYLASDDAAFVTGETLRVDGGMTAHSPSHDSEAHGSDET